MEKKLLYYRSLCVATEDNHEIPQSGQAVPLPKLDPVISPMQIRIISSANSFTGAVVRGNVLGALGLLMKSENGSVPNSCRPLLILC